MRVVNKIFIAILLVIVLITGIVAIWWFLPEKTPPIESTGGRSVSTIDYIPIGGIEQCVLIRSSDNKNPILLFLHGGPGMPMMYLAHEFQRPLEKHFTVIQWDRRGAGKTFSRNPPSPESMNTAQLISDAYDLIDTLMTRYQQQQVFLVAHSFGTYLGSIMVQEHPELFHAYISVGQVVDPEKAKILQKDFIREQAKLRGKTGILKELDNPKINNYETLLFKFGGELKNSTSFFPFIWSGLQAPEYTLPEVLNVARASSFSSKHMKYNKLSTSILQDITEYRAPVYFFTGRSDYTTPHELILEYFNNIEAPSKDFIYFDNSAHFPFFEEPEKFCEELIRLMVENP